MNSRFTRVATGVVASTAVLLSGCGSRPAGEVSVSLPLSITQDRTNTEGAGMNLVGNTADGEVTLVPTSRERPTAAFKIVAVDGTTGEPLAGQEGGADGFDRGWVNIPIDSLVAPNVVVFVLCQSHGRPGDWARTPGYDIAAPSTGGLLASRVPENTLGPEVRAIGTSDTKSVCADVPGSMLAGSYR